jgi:hypothetical protein
MVEAVGLPDGEQLMYYDDVNLAYKARIRDWHGRFVRGAVAYHHLPKHPPEGFAFRGPLSIAARFFPDDERRRVLKEAASRIEFEGPSPMKRRILCEVLQLDPYGTEAQRRMVWDQWKDKYCPGKDPPLQEPQP